MDVIQSSGRTLLGSGMECLYTLRVGSHPSTIPSFAWSGSSMVNLCPTRQGSKLSQTLVLSCLTLLGLTPGTAGNTSALPSTSETDPLSSLMYLYQGLEATQRGQFYIARARAGCSPNLFTPKLSQNLPHSSLVLGINVARDVDKNNKQCISFLWSQYLTNAISLITMFLLL